MITINKIIDGKCEALHNEFGQEYEVYTEDIPQNLTEPCFGVTVISSSTELYRGKRYYMTNAFCIYYFPKSKDVARKECFEINQRLLDCLEWITVDGDLTMGTKKNCILDNGVLSFFVNYDMFVFKQPEVTPYMENLIHSSEMKG